MSFSAQVRESEKIPVLLLAGKLVLGAPASSFRDAVDEIIRAGHQSIVVNFAGVPYADSAGVGALAFNFSRVKEAGGVLAIVAPQKIVVDLMDLTRLSSLIPIFSNEEEALASLLN